MKLVILDAATIGTQSELAVFQRFGELEIHEATKPEETAARISGMDCVVTNKVVIDKGLIDANPQLKLVCITATGTNNIDLEHAARKGLIVRNVAGYATESVAQFTFSALFHLISRLDLEDEHVRSGHYYDEGLFTHFSGCFSELKGKTFGIIGLGNIGRRIAEIATAFGTEVVYYSTSGQNTDQPYQQLSLEELLKRADVISINAPLNDRTAGLIHRGNLRRCKPDAILINTGRGGIVVEQDLADALDAGLLGAAALDVFEAEPLSPDNPLLHLEDKSKVLLSPHNAWTSREARAELIKRTAGNVADFLEKTH
ncbi:MAG: D-2-hydroxyacid dehydrogenase [Verrucomicrobiota bacterium]